MHPILKWNVGFFELLTLLFIGLKLSGKINWHWFFVLQPVLTSVLFGIVLLIIRGIANYVRRAADIRTNVRQEQHDSLVGKGSRHIKDND